jgi:hypothetical protein
MHTNLPIRLILIFGVLWLSTEANAQTKWLKATIYVCPTAKLNLDTCKYITSGPITFLSVAKDEIGREFYRVDLSGRIGYVSKYEFESSTQDEDPKLAAERERRRANAATKAAETKRLKQATEDEAAMATMPVETFSTPCILAAAERLPRIPGITIEASRAMPLPSGFKKELGLYQTIIEIDAKAAGVSATYRFACAKGLRAGPFVTGLKQ